MDKIRYPIGQFVANPHFSKAKRIQTIHQIADIVNSLRDVVSRLNDDQLQVSYRPGGWSTQQIIHHMADNDMNAYLRLKRALTEDEPIANSYREDLFAELNEYKDMPIEMSVLLLEQLHMRMITLLNSLQTEEFQRKFKTQALGLITIDTALQRFVWHNQHHISQIKSLKDNKGW
ncbi:metal-dependent hydrolase [Paenibacillus ferrarius]|uniref:Metal-dependent hydrolase n=1 Tax=Paenibacillus ferrarius TaxID=1469647 RepID=A0A1V4HLW6_9BACL|nr:putative metal-dependent hydrolase [Paenibacillus ferrarius]OPH57674.1 metal-dependent hydrolase [Paenibacillus ferrarius]